MVEKQLGQIRLIACFIFVIFIFVNAADTVIVIVVGIFFYEQLHLLSF